jgi:V/A-type H+-transporting ATPase subunit D
MAKIRLTKSELKAQRDGLKRFERYLPTLQLKKQQLQLEVRRVRDELRQLAEEQDQFEQKLLKWAELVDESAAVELGELVQIERCERGVRNIAGIDTPVFEALAFRPVEYDLFAAPSWYADAVQAVQKQIEFRLRRGLLEEQQELLEVELRTTTQRVNLFEKVKIPEAKEHIRRIQIYLGDQQANAVGRAKIAKAKCRARDEAQAVPA